jgi:2-haloacid dehalogenase
MSGIEEPHVFASDEDLKYILEQYKKLEARPGVAECFQMLRDAGFTVWALTAGGKFPQSNRCLFYHS